VDQRPPALARSATAHWHEQTGDPTVADSILDRVVHNAYRVERGPKTPRGATAMTGSQLRLKQPTGWFAAGGIVGNGNGKAEFISEVLLDLVLPGPACGGIAAAGVGHNQQASRVGVALTAFTLLDRTGRTIRSRSSPRPKDCANSRSLVPNSFRSGTTR
jgi:hypothetical protein